MPARAAAGAAGAIEGAAAGVCPGGGGRRPLLRAGRRDCTSRILPETSCRKSWNSGRRVCRCAGECTPENGRLRRGPPRRVPAPSWPGWKVTPHLWP